MKTPRSSLCLFLCAALMLLATSKGSAASILNIDINSVSGGSQSQISWYFTGDIVSAQGARLPLSGSGSFPSIEASFENLYNDSFKSTSLNVLGAGSLTTYSPDPSVGALSSDVVGSLQLWIVGYPNNPQGGVSINPTYTFKDDIYLTLGIPAFSGIVSWVDGSTVKYTPGIDSYLLPVAFNSFNQGTYSTGYSYDRYIDGLATVVNVVPEPSSYALFGLGAMGILIVLRRKKTA